MLLKRLRYLILSYLEVAIDFAGLYYFLPEGSFNQRFDNIIAALYFSAVTITTTGYGDVIPRQPVSQLLCVAEVGVGLVLVVFALGSYIAAIGLSQSQAGT
jgi:voltage-gated potassium channel Kch